MGMVTVIKSTLVLIFIIIIIILVFLSSCMHSMIRTPLKVDEENKLQLHPQDSHVVVAPVIKRILRAVPSPGVGNKLNHPPTKNLYHF